MTVLYLKDLFKARLSHDRTARRALGLPGGLEYSRGQAAGPRLGRLFGASRQIGWSTFDVAEERRGPAMVVEVTSPTPGTNDVGIKVDYYHRAGVPLYVIADVTEEEEDTRTPDRIDRI